MVMDSIDNVDACFKYDVFVLVCMYMLQDSFVDALINKNWIFRNSPTVAQISFKPVMTFFYG